MDGARVYLSRSLLPPDLIATLHDLLKLNGAVVYFCCDPSARSPQDFHVLFSLDSDKCRSLQEKGCQVVGPQCVFQCATQRRPLPKRSCTCCLALEGVRVYAAGLDPQEQAKIELLVTSMCGVLDTNVSSATNFVIATSVLFPEYQLARSLGKPIVSLTWLEQCYHEHQLVSHEPHMLPALFGLTICATQVAIDVRTRIWEAAVEHGASYSANLTVDCTHLIATAPHGPKYTFAKRWGSVKIVNQNWLWESIAMKVRLDENLFQLPDSPAHSGDTADVMASDMDASNAVSERIPEVQGPLPVEARQTGDRHESNTANSASRSHLYLSNCRFYIVGFQAEQLKRLVQMVHDGGGTRYMEPNKTVTHVVLGDVSQSELQTIQQLATWGAIHVVSSVWLEECAQEKQQISLKSEHAPAQCLQGKFKSDKSVHRSHSSNVPVDAKKQPGSREPCHRSSSKEPASKESCRFAYSLVMEKKKDLEGVFSGVTFAFMENYPVSQRGDVIMWIKSAGGSVEDGPDAVDYSIGFHGQSAAFSNKRAVSVHWIRHCIEAGNLFDISEHILYRPLSCRVPLPGFERFRFCISQYEENERILCRQLCTALGASFTEVLKKKVTHLLCKVSDGDKYQAALRWGIKVATVNWLYACVKQNALVCLEDYHPNLQSAQGDRDATGQPVSAQCPDRQGTAQPSASQRNRLTCGVKRKVGSKSSDARKKQTMHDLPDYGYDPWDELTASWPSDVTVNANGKNGDSDIESQTLLLKKAEVFTEKLDENCGKDAPELRPGEVGEVQQDVAAAIENLLAQTSKAKEESNAGGEEEDEHDLLSEAKVRDGESLLGQLSNASRAVEQQGETQGPSNTAVDAYEESQLDSQVVAYDEDHSGRQIIMERVRAGSYQRLPKTALSTRLGLGRLFEAAEANK